MTEISARQKFWSLDKMVRPEKVVHTHERSTETEQQLNTSVSTLFDREDLLYSLLRGKDTAMGRVQQ